MKKTFAVVGMLLLMAMIWTLRTRAEPSQKASASAKLPVPNTLDGLLAPVALYPDQLLGQILLSAGEPSKVTELDLWLKKNSAMKGTQLQNAAVKAGFEPSFVALALFPDVVARMAGQLEWTTLLGQAFVADRNAVFASIQKLRKQAQQAGTLKTTPQQTVEQQSTPAGEQVIVIEPTNPQIIYVPQYNSTTVYTTVPSSTTVVVQDNSAAVAAGVIGFTAGIAIGAAFDNNYYYGPYGWHGGGYMYADAWDDYYDRREDAREDWQDHREDIVDERGDRAEDRREQQGDRRETTQQQRTERTQTRQENRPAAGEQRTGSQTATAQKKSSGGSSYEARGYAEGKGQSAQERSGRSSDAFSGYSNGKSQRTTSSRGQQSRSSSRGGGGGRRR